MKILKYFVLIIIIFPLKIYATDIEILFGHYTYNNEELEINFDINSNGISNLVINGKSYQDRITYDYLGTFGSTTLLEVKVYESDTLFHVIKLLAFHNDREVLLVSGFYVKIRVNVDNLFSVINKKTVEINFTPLLY